MKRLFHRSRGFTLVELMVVMTIMSIMAAIVVPAVTGTTTAGRGTSMTADINTVQSAVERFVGDNPKGNAEGWPTSDGKLLTTTPFSVPIHWAASFVDKSDGISVKTFGADPTLPTGYSGEAKIGGSYLRTKIPHAGATRAADNKAGTLNDGVLALLVTPSGSAPNITLVNTATPTPATGWVPTGEITAFAVWRLDKTGQVYVNLNPSEY